MSSFYDEKNKLWGKLDQHDSSDREVSLGQMILKKLLEHGSKVAQINDNTGVRMTYQEIYVNTIRAAQNLQKRGLQPRDSVSFMTFSSDNLLPIFLASICLACPMVPLHPTLSKEETVRILTKTKPVVIFCDANIYDHISEALEEMKSSINVLIFGEQIDGLELVENLFTETGDENNFVPQKLDIENDAIGILCSSGTTGPSKCVRVSYRASMLNDPFELDEDSVCLSFDSIFWTVGFKPIIDSIQSGATRIITTDCRSSEYQLKLIEKYKVNYFYSASGHIVAHLKSDCINEKDLSSVKHLFLCGFKISNEMLVNIKRHFSNSTQSSWYGLTELGIVTSSDQNAQNINGGQLIKGFQAKIVDDAGNRCGPNTNGEIFLKTKNKFLGYFDDPMATLSAIDDEGFFQTGDIGHFDENGMLFIDDRKKNVMQVFYFDGTIFPSEIENVIIKMPNVEEVCVVGVPITPDGITPAAIVVPKPNSNLTKREIFNVVAENFPNRAKLRGGVYFVESLSKTYTGKLVRKEATKVATKMLRLAKDRDPEIQSFLSDIPKEYWNLI